MIKYLFSIKDDFNGFMNVFIDNNVEAAQRGFLHQLKIASKDSLFYAHPEDYHLYCLGSIDLDSGIITAYTTPEYVCTGVKNEDN